jgi:hypothetical protein
MQQAAATLSTKFWKGRQSLEAEQIVAVGSARLRARLTRDSYDEQSSIRLEAWSAEGWKHVTSMPLAQSAVKRHSYVARDAGWQVDAIADMGTLILEGIAFLDGLKAVPA